MKRHLRYTTPSASAGTPLGVAGRGIMGGVAGTLALSVLARVLPVLRAKRSPVRRQGVHPVDVSPALALTLVQSPGAEGLAEQFAFKVASGVFGRDLGPHTRRAGRAVHLIYGGAWGLGYGLVQGSYHQPAGRFGGAFGLLVWLVGPALLVPAMELMGDPMEEPVERTATLAAAHVVYGLTLAKSSETLQRLAR